MRTLIINGSPRKNGDTAALIEHLKDHLLGEIKEIRTYDKNISPCVDCRMCRKQQGCAIEDDMQEIYSYLEVCDNVVIASPIYFTELTGSLLSVCSRLQTYFSSQYFRKEEPLLSRKKGAVIMAAGGSSGGENAYETALCLLKCMNAPNVYPAVLAADTDKIPVKENKAVLKEVRRAAEFLSSP